MFGLLGFAEVLALVIIGGISAPLFLRPARRGGPVLVARRFDVNPGSPGNDEVWPAISIEGHQSGLIPRLLRLVGVHMATTLEVTEELITYQAAGLWRERRAAIPLSQVASAQCGMSQPVWHVSAVGVIVLLLVVLAGGGRLTPEQFGAGVVAAGVCGLLCALQRTLDLVVETSGGTKITLSFSALSLGQAITLQDVMHAAERITELAMQHQRRTAD